MKYGKLSTRFSLGISIIILITVALISIASNVLITRMFEDYMRTRHEKVSALLVRELEAHYDSGSGWNEEYIDGMGKLALGNGYIVKVFDADGMVVWSALKRDREACYRIMDEIERRMDKVSRADGEFVSHSFDLNSGGRVVGSAEITYYSPYYYDEAGYNFLYSINIVLFVICVTSLIAAVLVCVAFTRRITTPITRVTATADEIAKGNYSARAASDGKIRELEELSASINNMAEQIDKQEKARTRLTADVAHELRTPLAIVSAQLEVILDGILPPTDERLKNIYDEVDRLRGLVADLEKLNSEENAKLEKSPVSLMELARSVSSVFEAEMEKHSLTCTVEGDDAIVPADENKLRQVLVNLLSNAVKYSRKGGRVRVEVHGGDTEASISVIDDGIGISAEDCEHIFERFYRADRSRNRKTGGAGIGLAIVKAIVKAHGGRVEVKSKEGEGSTFSVFLPLEPRGRNK